METQILIIESDNSLRSNLVQHLRQEGFVVLTADRALEVVRILSASACQIVLLGLEGLKRDGLSMLRMIRQRFPHVYVITLNSAGQLDLSIESMRLGAYDDLLIPLGLDALMACIRKAQDALDNQAT